WKQRTRRGIRARSGSDHEPGADSHPAAAFERRLSGDHSDQRDDATEVDGTAESDGGTAEAAPVDGEQGRVLAQQGRDGNAGDPEVCRSGGSAGDSLPERPERDGPGRSL